jgi:hypothetical protein
MSPNAQYTSDSEEVRRAMSPQGTRASIKPANGLVQQPFPNHASEKRPPRSRDGHVPDDGTEAGGDAGGVRERAYTPDQPGNVRVKSPASRATSPNGEPYAPPGLQQPNIASIVAGSTNGSLARSPSPKLPPYQAPMSSSPTPPTISGSFSPPGSIAIVTADLIRDLKAKEAEMEEMKKREAWMKLALTKATGAGFVYEDTEAEALGLGDIGEGKDDEKRMREMAAKFKQFKAGIQVCSIVFMP